MLYDGNAISIIILLEKLVVAEEKHSDKDNKNQTVRQPDLLLSPIPPIQDKFLS